MAAAYSMDLRTRVLKDSDAGLSSKELAERYHVSRAWVDALKQRRRETGRDRAAQANEVSRRASWRARSDRLAALVTARPDATLAELREALPTSAGLTTIWRALDQLGLHRQKKRYTPTNNAGLTSPLSGAGGETGSRCATSRQYVFLDECGVTTDLLRRYGRSPRGTRLHDHTPCGHWQTHTVVAALRLDGLTAPGGVRWPDRQSDASSPTSSKSWCPRLRPGDVVVLDNLAVHKQPEVRAAIEAVGAHAPLSAALQSRFQSDRTGLRQTESVPPRARARAPSITSARSSPPRSRSSRPTECRELRPPLRLSARCTVMKML